MSVKSQKGSALIFVGIVGLVSTMLFALFMNSSVLVEGRAVEAELARSRVYWAQMGGFNYALSRISYSRLCDTMCGSNIKDTDLSPVLGSYLLELTKNRTWTYADEASGYSFTTSNVALPDDTSGRQTYSGWLMATSSYTASSLLTSSGGKLPLLELRLCIGLDSAGKKCDAVNKNNGGKTTVYFSISRLTNLPSP